MILKLELESESEGNGKVRVPEWVSGVEVEKSQATESESGVGVKNIRRPKSASEV